jgi:uncharacterized cysteine cluster protein YcgN (CxxCxxCC family)/dihydrodipicolinate synthase/N-acetylneuraminate lyase
LIVTQDSEKRVECDTATALPTTESDSSVDVPFWQRKRLDEMTASEWDSLCDRCGRCCLQSIRADDSSKVYRLDIGCIVQDPTTGGCSDYANRKSLFPDCFHISPENIAAADWLPDTCGYRRIHRGQDLEWWHPLVSGTLESVAAAGMSAAGRLVEARFAGILEYHTVDWAMRPVIADPSGNWDKAMFGGVNASVPTPFGQDNRVDIDLMAQHCFWLLSNGCSGLAVLDQAGEVASLAIAERIAILEGLQSRGVPVSKVLAGIGPASPADAARIAIRARELGIRGVMLRLSIPDKTLPRDVLSPSLRALMAVIPQSFHLYLSIAAGATTTQACVTALQAFNAAEPGRLKGIRDEASGCALGLATLDRLGGYPFEVYTADATMLGAMARLGGAGLIGPGANLVGLHCGALLRGAKPEQMVLLQRAIEAVGHVLRSHPTISGIKALLARQTGTPHWGRVRLPLRSLGAGDRAAFLKSFDATGVKLRPPVSED